MLIDFLLFYIFIAKAVSSCGNEQSEWRPAEAALFCIRAISNYVSVVEANVMPQVYLDSSYVRLSLLIHHFDILPGSVSLLLWVLTLSPISIIFIYAFTVLTIK